MPRKKNKFLHKKIKPAHLPWVIISLAAIILVAVTLYLNNVLDKELNRGYSQKVDSIAYAWVEFDFGGNKKRRFSGEFSEAFPLASVLNKAAREGKISIKYQNGRVLSVDGKKGNWQVLRNNKLVKTNINGLVIESGDNYLIRLGAK